jgi:hypothetical protein
VSKLKPVLIIWILLVSLLLIPLGVWASISTDQRGLIAANFLVGVAALTLMALATYYGWNLIQTLKHIPNVEMKNFLKKVISHDYEILDLLFHSFPSTL